MSLRDKKIVVVGASGDIGTSICELLRVRGAAVIEGTSKNCDVTSPAQVKSFMGMAWAAEPAHRMDGLVTCHGAPGCIKPTLELTDEEFSRVIEIDLLGTLRACREAVRYMGGQGYGRIVTVSSIHAIATYPERAAYAAAKAGVAGLSRALAIEWAKDGIQVNCVLPGQVSNTRRTDRLGGDPRLKERTPSGRLVDSDDVCDAVMYLLDSSGVNGHSLVVDDGWLSSAWFGPHV